MSLYVHLNIVVDTGGEKPQTIQLFTSNITHNLTEMADDAGIYKALWRPEEINAKYAGDIIEIVESGLSKMKKSPELYKIFDTPNGWGTYEQFIPWIEEYLEACKKHPKAIIEISR